MLSRQFQKLIVAVLLTGRCRDPRLSAVAVSGGNLQLLGHLRPNDEHRTITAPNAMLYSRHVSVRYCDMPGARRPPSSEALPSDPVFHEKLSRAARISPARPAPAGPARPAAGPQPRGFSLQPKRRHARQTPPRRVQVQ
jgi:hypothetical protein